MGDLALGRRVVALLIAFAVGGALALVTLSEPAGASSATLNVLSGNASVVHDGAARAATDGETISASDTVTTAGDGYALLSFVDGSTLSMAPGTTVVVEEASAHPGSTVTRLSQAVGRSWSSVQRFASARSRYEIRTPSVTATVRGTAFAVDVAPDGTTAVHTLEGVVGAINDQGEVLVVAGTQVVVAPRQAPPAPQAPPPAPVRTFRIESAELVVVDQAGRACGLHPSGVVQQIPGCVVRNGEIRIEGEGAVAKLTLVSAGTAPVPSSVEQVVVPGTGPASASPVPVEAPASALPIVVATPAPTSVVVTDVQVPLIGPVPVVVPTATPVPASRASASPLAVPPFELPALPLSTPAPARAAPTLAPTPLPTALVTAAPILAPTPLPSIAVTASPTVGLSPLPTVQTTPLPIFEVTPLPTAEATLPPLTPAPAPPPTPAPTTSPTQAPTPTPTPLIELPTPTLPPAPSIGL